MSMPIIKSSNIKRCQSITDIVESVALQETGLSHILNAEGEKIQKALETSTSNEELIKVNSSVKEMIKAITILESVLQDKIHLAVLFPCESCPVDPCVTPKIAVTVEDAATGTIDSTIPELYLFTGKKVPAKLVITITPAMTVSVTKTLPAGVTFTNNIISIAAGYDWGIGHALGFAVGEGACKVDFVVSIKPVS